MKLKAVLAVTAALSFGGAFAQANFSDVPAGHWAKDAVEKMAAQGCIIGFPDGTFRGNEGLTRYQAALILARCLQNTTVVGGLDNETVESLKNAVQELSSELAALGVRIADVEDNAATKDDVAVLEERIAALEEAAGDKGEPVEGGDEEAGAEVQAAIDELVAADEAAAAQIEDLTGALDELVNQLEELATAQDELTSRVEALEAGAGEGEDNGDVTAALEDLAAGQDDLNGRVDELAATLDDVAVSIDDLNARVDELAAAGEENAAVLEEINARIEELAGAIDDVNVRVDELEGTVGDVAATVEGQTEQIESNAASIVALQDLTVLLNEDIVGLEDRISALESDKANAEDVDARFTNLNRDLTDLTNRVTVVETNLSDLQGKFNTLNGNFGFTVSGSLTSEYYVSRLTGRNFDIDRIIPGTKFSSGVDGDGDDKTKDRPWDYVDFGDIGADGFSKVEGNGFSNDTRYYYFDKDNTVNSDGKGTASDDLDLVVLSSDTQANTVATVIAANPKAVLLGSKVYGDVTGITDTTLTLKLDFANKAIEGKSAYTGAMASDTQAFNVHKVVAEFGIADLNADGTVGYNNYKAGDPNPTAALNFYVKGITTQFDINGAPIKFTVGEELKTQFTPFVFDNEKGFGFGDGFLATVDGSTLPGLGSFSPKITVAYGSEYDGTYNRGIRATISPLADTTLGLSAAQDGTDSTFGANSFTQTVFGADLKAKISGWNVQSEYATETETEVLGGVTSSENYSIFYAHADGTVGPVSLRGDIWSLDPDFWGVSNDSGDDNKVPFNDVLLKGSEGAHIEAKAALGAFSVGGYFDRRGEFGNAAGYNLTGFGANASGNISIFKVGAYYDSLTEVVAGVTTNATRLGGTAGVTLAGFSVDGYAQSVMVDGTQISRLPAVLNAIKPFNEEQVSQAGVDVKGALGPVNLKAGFKIDSGFVLDDGVTKDGSADWDRTTITVDADATFAAGIATIKPFATLKSIRDADLNSNDYTQLRVGVSATTGVLDAFLKPSLNARVSYYQSGHTDVGAVSYVGYAGGDFTATELEYSIGVKSEAFLFEKSTFALTWAASQNKNVNYVPFSGKNAGYSVDTPLGGDINLAGIYGEWNYYDLNFAYGDFTLNDNGAVSNGQAFKISYKVKF